MSQAADHVSTMYLTINRERIPVPESVIKAIRKENNHVRYLARREHRCAQPNYSLCRGDCQLCRWKCMGIIENFEEAEARYNLVDDTDIEADFLLKDTINEIMQFANQVTESGATLLTMHYVQHRSKREIARLMHGLPFSEIRARYPGFFADRAKRPSPPPAAKRTRRGRRAVCVRCKSSPMGRERRWLPWRTPA